MTQIVFTSYGKRFSALEKDISAHPLFICAWCGWLKYLKGTHGICQKHYDIQEAEIATLAQELAHWSQLRRGRGRWSINEGVPT